MGLNGIGAVGPLAQVGGGLVERGAGLNSQAQREAHEDRVTMVCTLPPSSAAA